MLILQKHLGWSSTALMENPPGPPFWNKMSTCDIVSWCDIYWLKWSPPMATQEQSRTPSLGLEHILSQMWKNKCKTLFCFAEMHLPNSSTQTWGPASFL